MKQLAALLAAAAVAPARAAIVDEDVARRVFESAGESLSSVSYALCCFSTLESGRHQLMSQVMLTVAANMISASISKLPETAYLCC